MKNTPLLLAKRMTNKTGELFRRMGRPGFALFSDAGSAGIAAAQRLAAEAAAENRAALAALDAALADGRIDPAEVDQIRWARGKIGHSAALDERLAEGGAA